MRKKAIKWFNSLILTRHSFPLSTISSYFFTVCNIITVQKRFPVNCSHLIERMEVIWVHDANFTLSLSPLKKRIAVVKEKASVAEGILGKYFKYDADTRSYKRSDKPIPTDISCREIREQLYTHGFDIDDIHYVRYKRSAGASRDGRCLFIAEPLYADMMAWSSCDLSADNAYDQASFL